MITARYDPPLLFPRERSPSPHLGTSRRGCTPPSSSSSLADGEEIDRFMELAHAALEEATKEEDAKGVLHELVERVLVKTGAPLLAGVIAEQWRSQEVIEQLAEKSFERQRRRQLQQSSSLSTSSTVSVLPLSANKKRRRMKRPASDSTRNEKQPISTSVRPSSSPAQHTISSSSSSSSSSTTTTTTLLSSTSESSESSTSESSTSESSTSESLLMKDPHDPDSMEEAVTRDQFIIQQSHSLHAEPDRLLLVSEYIWRLFRLLILASLVALVYHYVCTYPHQLFLVV